ncbi:MAG: N-acetylmuramoyl-L-alanine amidase [Nocardioidaceae bacterium]
MRSTRLTGLRPAGLDLTNRTALLSTPAGADKGQVTQRFRVCLLALFASAVLLAPGLGHLTPAEASATSLTGRVVVIDPGHNGGNASHPAIVNRTVYAGNGYYKPCNTVGTATNTGYSEHALNWNVAKRVRAILVARGATVVMTRPSDTGVGPCINKRAAIGNDYLASAVVSIHADGGPSTGRGFHVIQPGTSLAGSAMVGASHRLALKLRASFKAESGFPYATYTAGGDGLATRRDLGGLNLSRRPAVFIECANMRNATDARILKSDAGRARIARSIADGITAFLS